MKRTGLVLLLGLFAGVAAHIGWFDARRPEPVSTLESHLAWMKAQLQLDAAQFARIKALHEELEPHLHELAAEVARLRAELAAFEQERRTSGQVDFVEFARFTQERRAVERDCAESTRRLITASSDVMTPEQRDRYLAMIAPALKDANAMTIR